MSAVGARQPKFAWRSWLLAAAAAAAGTAEAATLYVDGTLAGACTQYDPATRLCRGGTASAYPNFTLALAAASPGDIVLVRGGSYNGERIVAPRSGTPTSPITIRAYSGETPVLAGASEPTIFLRAVSYLVIEGLTVQDALGWGRLEDASYITLRGNRFLRATASGTTGGLKLVRSHYNRLFDNLFEDGNDNLVVQESDRNLIQGNRFNQARHSLLSVRCGNYNVIRANHFRNTNQKAMEIYDCEGVSDAPYRLDATRRNLIELNRFTWTRASSRHYDYNGIQYAGQQGIVRRNFFYDNQGGAVSIQVYADEALYNYGHRLYHNTFYNNRCYGLSAADDVAPTRYYDIRVRNNLFYRNTDCSGGTVQVRIDNPQAVVLESNALATAAPPFVDEAARDLRLAAGSPHIDAGMFLTFALGAGSGTRLVVDDTRYFYDGYGIPGESGDLIQLEGTTETARVVALDDATRTLVLDRPLSWRDRQGVHLVYTGARPDLGADEYGLGDKTPSAPSRLTVSVAEP
jgi:hypothetical protein